MPWEIIEGEDKYCVHKKGDPEPLKCYDSESDAKDYLAALYASEGSKMGARNNREDRRMHREIRGKAKEIHDLSMALEPLDEDAPKMEDAQIAKTIKADLDALMIPLPDIPGAVKALGDWELEVLGVPFGGPKDGKDSDGQFFSPKTNTYKEYFKTIPAYYYHSINPDGRTLQDEPVLIGTAQYERTDTQGHWFRVKLNKAVEFAKRIWDAAKRGIARASSGSLSHIVRVDNKSGEILHWPVAELSLIDAEGKRQPANAWAVATPVMKANYEKAQLEFPIIPPDEGDNTSANGETPGEGVNSVNAADPSDSNKGVIKMDETVKLEVQEALKAALAARDAEVAAKKAEEDRIALAVKEQVEKETEKIKADFAASRRLPDGAPYVSRFAEMNKYDNLDASETSVLLGVMESARKRPSAQALKALAIKLSEDKGDVGKQGQIALKAAGITDAVKTDYANFTTSTSGGTEWVGTAYSTALWEAIRVGTFVLGKLPQIEVPQGMSSIYLPFENTDPTWYSVAEYAPTSGAVDVLDGTVTASRLETGRAQLTLGKLGARVIWSGELEEDSLIPWVGQLRDQLAKSGSEYLESAIIDGDTTTAAGNINSSTAATADGTYYLIFDGLRHLGLVGNTNNARSGAGSLDVTDYLETVKLMGSAGINGLDKSKVSFIVDPLTLYKTMTLPEVLTRDVASSPVLENGSLTGLWGYKLDVSGSMCKTDSSRLSTLTGIIDDGSLTKYGSILAVRWDQWRFGWKRRMTLETTRIPRADASEIVAMMRVGLKYRDTEAAAISYYLGV